MIIKATGADPLLIVASIYMAIAISPWWILWAPAIVLSWFFRPRWSNKTGWKFLHDSIEEDRS